MFLHWTCHFSLFRKNGANENVYLFTMFIRNMVEIASENIIIWKGKVFLGKFLSQSVILKQGR